ncbi:beta-lactamase/transpeptidase-like protein [Xylariales sp. AK1849]|nr:beta-lactamase/transpeptidase-like protein [Xylariales sp. AK1849]
MDLLRWALLLSSIQRAQVLSMPNCPIYGAEFPKPGGLEENPIWKAAMLNLSNTFDAVEIAATNCSFSVQVFSTNPGSPILFERFHTAQNLPGNSTGVKKVDADTVYRIGSVTKLFTVLTFLAEAGDKYFSHPITEFVPELATISSERATEQLDNVRTIDWDDINILSLLSQMSGIERDCKCCEMHPHKYLTEKFFEGLKTAYPSFAPWTTPAYSNIAFQILSYALENITGKSFISSLTDSVLTPLNLNRTYYYSANESVGIIPREVNETSWNVYIGDESPSGNMFSSARDLSSFGIAVLNSTLLRPSLTRRWLKPVTFSADFVAAVGMPWGLRRLHLSDTNPARTVTAFTKAGGVGDYSALLSVIPEFDIGIAVLVAGADTPGVVWSIADYLGAVLLPNFDAATRDDANSKYGGTYQADPASNLTSSLQITTDPDRPGLGAASWISNGTDMIPIAEAFQSGLSVASDPAASNSTQPSVRLYYTGLDSTGSDGTTLKSFKAVFEDLGSPTDAGNGFSTDCGSWIDYTGVTYAGLPLDEFIFELDENGDVFSVKNLALNVTLRKTE